MQSGVAPALSDPPQFAILSVKKAHEYRQEKKYPYEVLEQLNSMRRNLKEPAMLCICRSNFGFNVLTISNVVNWYLLIVDGIDSIFHLQFHFQSSPKVFHGTSLTFT